MLEQALLNILAHFIVESNIIWQYLLVVGRRRQILLEMLLLIVWNNRMASFIIENTELVHLFDVLIYQIVLVTH